MNIEGITEMRHHLHSICPELFSKTHPHHLPSTEPFISKFPWSCDPPIFSIISSAEWGVDHDNHIPSALALLL